MRNWDSMKLLKDAMLHKQYFTQLGTRTVLFTSLTDTGLSNTFTDLQEEALGPTKNKAPMPEYCSVKHKQFNDYLIFFYNFRNT